MGFKLLSNVEINGIGECLTTKYSKDEKKKESAEEMNQRMSTLSHFRELSYDHDRINSVTNIPQGMILFSKSNNYFLILQTDGNLVLYVSSHFVPKNAIWSSKTHGVGEAPFHLRLQDDGNLVIFDRRGQPTWASTSANKGQSPYQLVVQDDGNLVIYDVHKKPTFATDTWRS